jgi:hypothetical protein
MDGEHDVCETAGEILGELPKDEGKCMLNKERHGLRLAMMGMCIPLLMDARAILPRGF